MCERTGQWLVVRQGVCGKGRMIPADCGDPCCNYCEPRRARIRMDHWGPVVQAMRFPVQLVLTIKDGPDLKEQKKIYEEARRRLLDKRLGSRNRPGLVISAKTFVREHYRKEVEKGKVEQFELDDIIGSHDLSIDKFDRMLDKANASKGPQRVRDLMGPGVGLLEITVNGDWHWHRHLVYDAQYIPWAYLVVLWKEATRGEGEVVHIGKVGKTDQDMLELFKYTSKPWEIPEPKKQELRDAIKGVKRVQALGGAKPVDVQHPCPICGDEGCKAGYVDHVEGFEVVHLGSREYRVCGVAEDDVYRRLCFEKLASGWTQVNAESVYLILRELACHSTPAPPAQLVLVGT
jgi:hypothetical protein